MNHKRVNKNASQLMIRTSYRKLAREFHPDKNLNGTEEMQKINFAYEVLIDPQEG